MRNCVSFVYYLSKDFFVMSSPGDYRPDCSIGTDNVFNLPPPHHKRRTRNRKYAPCPTCGQRCSRRIISTRTLHDIGDATTQRPVDIQFTFSVHLCRSCKKHFSIDLTDIADPGSHYTKRVVDLAVRFVAEDGSPYRDASWRLWRDHRVFVPFATIQNWVEAAGKKNVLED
jgi:transcription elongation factor Elf1